MSLNEKQTLLFEELLKTSREEYPDALDYTLQMLCFKLARDGHLDTNATDEEIQEVRNKYEKAPTLIYTE